MLLTQLIDQPSGLNNSGKILNARKTKWPTTADVTRDELQGAFLDREKGRRLGEQNAWYRC
jgi:hypothetical protein